MNFLQSPYGEQRIFGHVFPQSRRALAAEYFRRL